jgi:4-hydroxyacetophenone monooxygenase
VDVGGGEQWLFDNAPQYRKWYRFWLFWMLTDSLIPFVTADADWQGDPQYVGALNEELGAALLGQIGLQAGEDTALLKKVSPTYAIGGKRSLRDNGVWIEALKKPNVHLMTNKIARITETGIALADGTALDVDAIIYGTGFYASKFLWPMHIKGKSGVDIHDTWAGDARAYLGMTVPDYPNFFCIYGPNTNIVVNGSIIFFSECSVNYIMGCIGKMIDEDIATLECKKSVHDAFNVDVDAANAQMAWGAANVNSWYKSASGRVSQNWPFPLVTYWERTRSPEMDDFIITQA